MLGRFQQISESSFLRELARDSFEQDFGFEHYCKFDDRLLLELLLQDFSDRGDTLQCLPKKLSLFNFLFFHENGDDLLRQCATDEDISINFQSIREISKPIISFIELVKRWCKNQFDQAHIDYGATAERLYLSSAPEKSTNRENFDHLAAPHQCFDGYFVEIDEERQDWLDQLVELRSNVVVQAKVCTIESAHNLSTHTVAHESPAAHPRSSIVSVASDEGEMAAAGSQTSHSSDLT